MIRHKEFIGMTLEDLAQSIPCDSLGNYRVTDISGHIKSYISLIEAIDVSNVIGDERYLRKEIVSIVYSEDNVIDVYIK